MSAGVALLDSFQYDDAAHRYKINGRRFRSVTGILGAGIPKPALVYWAAKVVAEYVATEQEAVKMLWASDDHEFVTNQLKALPTQQRDTAAVRGTTIHGYADKLVRGLPVDVAPEHVPWVEGYASFLDRNEIEAVYVEEAVVSLEPEYAGRFDLIARSPKWFDNQPFVLDLKTSNSVYRDTAYQNAAYARADVMICDGHETQMPNLQATTVAHVTSDGTTLYRLADTPDEIDRDFEIFKAAYVIASRSNKKLEEIA